MRSVRWGNLEGWHNGRHWGVGDDGRIRNLFEKIQCERGDFSHRKWGIYFPNRRWTNHIFWRRSSFKNNTVHIGIGSTNSRRKSRWFFLENQNGLLRHSTTHFRTPVKRLMIFGPHQEISFTAITLTPESNFSSPRRIIPFSTEIFLTYPELLIRFWMSNQRNASMMIGLSMGLETCLIFEQVHTIYLVGRNLLTDVCGPGGDQRGNSLQPGQIIYGQSSGNRWESTSSWKKSKSGTMKSSILKTLENYEEFISLTLRTRNAKKPLRMFERNWNRQRLPICHARQERRESMWRSVVRPIISNQNLLVSWKPVNPPQDFVWENLYPIIMMTISNEKETKSWKFQQLRQHWTRNGKIGDFFALNWRKSEVKRRWSMKQGH